MATTDNYQKKVANSSDEDLVQVPVRVNPETADEFRANHPDVPLRMWKIGGKKYLCAIYLLPKGQADDFLRMQQTEAKKEQREERCLIPCKGGFTRCPEHFRCASCEKASSLDFDSMRPTSLESLVEDADFEPQAPDLAEDDEEAANEMMSLLIQRLGEIKPRYASIFRELLDGESRPLHIARKLDLGKSQTYTDVPMVQALARRIYFEIMNQ